MERDESDDNSFVIINADHEGSEHEFRVDSPTLNQEAIVNQENAATEDKQKSKCQKFTNLIFRSSTKMVNYCFTQTKQKQEDPAIEQANETPGQKTKKNSLCSIC